MELYAQVILPLAVEGTFSYIVPERLIESVKVGCRVIVPFGPRKFYTGIIESLSPRRPSGMALKEIAGVPGVSVVLRHPQLKFWEWMADYYLCTRGDVMRAALPAALKLESETEVSLIQDEEGVPIDDTNLSESEKDVVAVLLKGKKNMRELAKAVNFSGNPMAIVSRLIDKGVVTVYERVKERFHGHKITEVEPLFDIYDPDDVSEAFMKLRRAPRLQQALMGLLDSSRKLAGEEHRKAPVPKEMLTRDPGIVWGHYKSLEDKGLVRIISKNVSPFYFDGTLAGPLPQLSAPQIQALDEIHLSFLTKKIVLLHGVTASGKTEIYIRLIDHMLREGQQVLMLVPEIALTTQLTSRMQAVFGDTVVVFHSKFTETERSAIWMDLLGSTRPVVVLGARSAVFLPFHKLGLVIVDEEHEASYKQADPAPRYNGRDAAIMLAMMHGAKALLGSATPSVETYYKATTGKFGLVTLSTRFSGVELPDVEVVDMTREKKRGAAVEMFSHRLVSKVREATDAGRQAILFLNRRGYSPLATCRMCGYVAKCDFCDVSLTYHRSDHRLVCHYCGASYPVPDTCPNCHEPAVTVVGYGTERLEESLSHHFPDSKILRMDLDTTRDKTRYSKIISDFSEKRASILVGTQMVTKGLDFAGVETVGVVNADAAINFPDFRASERAFNMMSQVAGRAGRRDLTGSVIIQTHNPAHPVVEFVKNHDYAGFYQYEVEERRKYLYPPFVRIINIYLRHREEAVIDRLASIYADRMRQLFGNRVSGPVIPHVGRVQNFHIRNLMLKIELEASPSKVKQILRQLYIEMQNLLPEKGMVLYYDVDPM